MKLQAQPGLTTEAENASAKLVSLLFAVVVLFCAALFAATGDANRRNLILLGIASGTLLLAFWSRHPRLVLIFFWVISFTYNRNYYSFDAILGNNGAHGLYWIPADLYFAALMAAWFVETALLKLKREPAGPRLWPWFLPFAAVCLISIFGERRPDWGVYELIRIAVFGLILWYMRFNIGKKEWWTVVSGFGAAMVLQTVYDLLGSYHLMSLAGATGGVESALDALARQDGPDINATITRATGTMTHPIVLATYLVLLVPVLVALALSIRRRSSAWLCAVAGLFGLYGVVMSMARTAWMVAAVELGLLLVGLVACNAISAKRAIGMASVTALLLTLALLPFSGKLAERWSGNFSESLDFRMRLDRIGVQIWTHAPYFGVGLNNHSLWLADYDPEQVRKFEEGAEILRIYVPVRAIAAVHNFYIYTLTETGMVGLSTFLMFAIVVIGRALKSFRNGAPEQRAAALGIAIGILGMLAFGMTDWGIWIDPILFTFAVMAGMANNLPVAFAANQNPLYLERAA